MVMVGSVMRRSFMWGVTIIGLWVGFGCNNGESKTADGGVKANASEMPKAVESTTGAPESKSAANRSTRVNETQWPDGKPRSSEEGYDDENGNFVLHGIVKTWYDNGLLKTEIHYRDGIPHGVRKVWHNNGKPWSEGEFAYGKSHGVWSVWFPSGIKGQEIHFDHGTWNGTYSEWHENGKKKLERNYVNGKIQGAERIWDENGREMFVVPTPKPESTGH